eukprot:c11552_g1_i1.p1 GENE.c11552_g1_i1~~c11552_g1_i1.p1  ORF type:complete len:289 (-),score=48.58 c11552_g1_i1:39-905(-)
MNQIHSSRLVRNHRRHAEGAHVREDFPMGCGEVLPLKQKSWRKSRLRDTAMPNFVVVRCFKCNMFQVTQEKKQGLKAKFTCAVCHEKQSFRRMFAKSEQAKNLRNVVMQMNMAQGEIEQQLDEEIDSQPPKQERRAPPTQPLVGIDWAQFVPEPSPQAEPQSDDDEATTEMPTNTRKKRNKPTDMPSSRRTPRSRRASPSPERDADSPPPRPPSARTTNLAPTHQTPNRPSSAARNPPPNRPAPSSSSAWDSFLPSTSVSTSTTVAGLYGSENTLDDFTTAPDDLPFF